MRTRIERRIEALSRSKRAASRRARRDDHAYAVVLAATLRTNSNAIDIGANEGGVLRQITSLAPEGRHFAFEPIPQLSARLEQSFPEVEVRQTALSDREGAADFAFVRDSPAYSGLRERADLPRGAAGTVERISVRTARLDDVLPDDYVPALVKIDVEGAELQVMRGARETLARHRPLVLFEHGMGGADTYGTQPGEVFDLLTETGMRIFDLDGSGPYSRERFESTFTKPIWNFLAAAR